MTDVTALEDDADADQESEVTTTDSVSTDETAPVMADLDPGELEGQGQGEEEEEEPEENSIETDEKEEGESNNIDIEKPQRPQFFLTTANGDYSSMEIGSVRSDEPGMSQSSSMDTLSDMKLSPRHRPHLRKGVSEDGTSEQDLQVYDIDVSEAIQPTASSQMALRQEGDIGSLTDGGVPIVHCIRILCSRFLLTGYQQGLIPDRMVRVSVKALALSCIGHAISLHPQAFFYKLHKGPKQGKPLTACQHSLNNQGVRP